MLGGGQLQPPPSLPLFKTVIRNGILLHFYDTLKQSWLDTCALGIRVQDEDPELNCRKNGAHFFFLGKI